MTNTHDHESLQFARRLIALGVPVFIARPAGIGQGTGRCGYWLPGGWETTLATPATLDGWTPEHAVAAVCGHGLDVIDVDPRNGGLATYDAILNAGAMPAVYATVRTPRNGTHYYVASLGVNKFKHGGVDVQAGSPDGRGRGFAFLPGTDRVYETGEFGTYTVDDDLLDEYEADATGAELLHWFRARGVQIRTDTSPETVELVGPERVTQARLFGSPVERGEHDERGVRMAAALARAGFTGDQALVVLRTLIATFEGVDRSWPFTDDDIARWWKGALQFYQPAPELRVDVETGEILPDESWKPLDWQALWDDESDDEWLCEPLIAAARGTVLYSPAKTGKSLLTLEIAANLACGRDALGFRPARPIRVVVLDHENDPRSDTRDRLRKMGFKPADLSNLFVLSYPIMAPLDTYSGGQQALAIALRHEADLVVIDTVSRAIEGEENDNNTWLQFYRNTGVLLKRAGIAMLRLDHSGKDESKGQRGGSAKTSDVDLVWRLSEVVKDQTYKLECTHNRMQVHEKTITLTRTQFPLGHAVESGGRASAWFAERDEMIRMLDKVNAPLDVSLRAAALIVKAQGGRPGKTVADSKLGRVLEARRERSAR